MKEKSIQINFRNDKMPKEGSHCICLSLVLTGSILKMSKSYYPQLLLEEFKYIVKERKVTRHITEDLEYSDDDLDISDEQ